MPKISVIIPVYNAQDFLKKCLDSVCNQTLKDIEIICVNDCSTDHSIGILNEYAAKYPNMRVIDCKVNGGESVARNIGLDKASGEYLAFVDNDDVLDLDFYEKLYAKAQETNADIVKGEALVVDFDGKTINNHLNEDIRKHNSKWFFEYEWWSAIYKTKMIREHNIRLPEGFPFGGDLYFLRRALRFCQRFEIVDGVFYYWLRHEGSGESQILSDKKIDSALFLHEKILDELNVWYKDKQIDELSYSYLVECNINIGITYLFRNCSQIALKRCVEHILYVYQNNLCPQHIENFLNKNFLILSNCLKNNKIDEIMDEVSLCHSYQEFLKKNMLAKLRRHVVYG